jgi:flagellar basal-body rod modification protein FlgD
MTSLAIPSSTSGTSAAASTTATAAASGSSAASAANLTQADFLQLLTAQLQYQSPTNPADPTQLASEFAAIEQVDSLNSLNSKVASLQSSLSSQSISEASNLVGKQVGVSGNSITANAAGSGVGAFNLAGSAKSVDVSVIKSNGTVAGTLDLGALGPGQQDFTFTGGSANAHYTYSVTATGTSGSSISVTPYSVYTVEGVNVSANPATLNVQGDATTIPVSSVQTVLGSTTSS